MYVGSMVTPHIASQPKLSQGESRDEAGVEAAHQEEETTATLVWKIG
jgi:hypothetical protein